MDFDKGFGVHLLDFGDASGASLGVPVTVQSACSQDEGIIWTRRLGQSFGVAGGKFGSFVGVVELQIGVEPFAIFSLTASRMRPLSGAISFENLVAQSGDIAGATLGESRKFGIDFGTIIKRKLLGKAQPPPDFGEDFPIGLGFSWRGSKCRTEGDDTFGIGHHSGFFAPLRGREKDVSVFRGFGGIVSILIDGKWRSG